MINKKHSYGYIDFMNRIYYKIILIYIYLQDEQDDQKTSIALGFHKCLLLIVYIIFLHLVDIICTYRKTD